MTSSCCTGTANHSELPDGKTMCAQQGVETTEVDRIVEIETVQDIKVNTLIDLREKLTKI